MAMRNGVPSSCMVAAICVPNNASRPWERFPDASPRSRAGLPCASAGAKRKARPVTLQIATALRGASPNPALHWAGTARMITRKPASGLATKHTEMKGSVPSHLRCDARCIFFFLLQLRFLSRCQYTASQHYRADQGCPRFDAARDPTQGRAASHQPLTAPRTLKEPAIGCGCEISASFWPCNTLQRARRRSAFPKTVVPSSTAWDAHEPSAIFRQFLVAHLLRQQNQAAGSFQGFDDTAYTRCDLYALGAPPQRFQAVPPSCSSCQLEARRRRVLLCGMTPVGRFLQRRNYQGQKTAPDARKVRKHIQCTSTWRSTHLGKMYDGTGVTD